MKYPFIVKVPGINSGGKTEGCRNAGNAIIAKLKEDFFTTEDGVEIDTDKLDLEEIHVDNSNLEQSDELIYKNALESFETKPKVIFLGGDHSLGYPLARAFFDYCNKEQKEPCLIIFDAHPDCMDLWEDNEFPDHEEWLSALVKKGFKSENIMLVGVRKSHKSEIEFMNKNKIKRIGINSIQEDIDNIADTLMEFSHGKELYISVDVDVLDPVFAPSTHYCEPGGLTSRELIYLLQRLSKVKTLKAVDIVEINSVKDVENNDLTVKIGAKILSEFL